MAPSIASSSATAPASRKISARSSTRPSLASTGSAPTASTSSGIATPENGSASIAASLSSRRSKRSDPTVSCTPCRPSPNTGTFSRQAPCGLCRMDTAIQHSQESLRGLAKRYGVNPKTVAKWRARTSVSDRPTGPKKPKSTVLSVEEEAVVIAFRRHTLLPLDDCLYALQPTIPHLTRSSLHRCLQRHGISRLPQVEGEASAKRKFKAYPIGYFHIDIAEVRTAQGKLYLLVAIDRRSKFAFVELHEKVARRTAGTSCVG